MSDDRQPFEKITIDGTADGSFTSYFDPEKHGDMSKTVGGTTEDDTHSEETISWPDEVDPAELTEKQRKVFELALRNPMRSAESIDREVDTANYTREKLREKAPEWYKTVFKQQGNSQDANYNNRYSNEDFLAALEEHGQLSTTEMVDEIGCTRKTVRERLEEIDKVESTTEVDGYHASARVYSLANESTTDESTQDDVAETEEAEIPPEGFTDDAIAEVLTVCEYLKRKDTPEGELAAWICEMLE